MSVDIIITLVIIIAAIVLFIQDRLSIDTVSILVMVTFMVTGILTPEEGFSGFNNTATITVAAMFVLSAAIFKSGALNKVTTLFVKSGKTHYIILVITIMLITGVMSAFINDTAVVAMFMPVVLKVAHDANIPPSRLLMPLSFGALMGGVCTLVETSTNILVSGIASKNGLEPFAMFEMTKAGVWFLGAGILYMIVAGVWLLPKRKSDDDLSKNYDLENYIAEIKLLDTFHDGSVRISDYDFIKDNDVEILRIIRQHVSLVPYPAFVLESGDILKVRCNVETLKKLEANKKVELVKSGGGLLADDNDNARLIEVMINPDSQYSGKSLNNLRWQNVFGQAAILAIRSRNEILHDKLHDVPLKTGDIILARVNQEQQAIIRDNRNFFIISEMESTSFDFKKVIPIIGIVALAIVTAAMGWMPIVLSAPAAILLLIIFKLISPEEAYYAVQWKVIFMLAGVLSMGLALEKTGAAAMLGHFITDSLGQFGPRLVLSAFFFITFMITNVMSNNASAALLAPIAIVTAESMGISARPLLMAVTFAASLSFMTPMSYQTNAMIYGPGNYKFSDYLKVGTPLNLLLWLIASFIIPYYFPF